MINAHLFVADVVVALIHLGIFKTKLKQKINLNQIPKYVLGNLKFIFKKLGMFL